MRSLGLRKCLSGMRSISTVRNVLITGSTSGIGLSIASKFAENGHNVMLNGFGDVDKAIGTVRNASVATDQIVGYHGADLTNPEEIKVVTVLIVFPMSSYFFGSLEFNGIFIKRIWSTS